MAVTISRFKNVRGGGKRETKGLDFLIDSWRAEKKIGLSTATPFPENLGLPKRKNETEYFVFEGNGELDFEREIGDIGSVVIEIAKGANITIRSNPVFSQEIIFVLENGANLIFEESSGDVDKARFLEFFVEEKAHLHAKAHFSGGGFSKEIWHARLLAPGARTHFNSVFSPDGKATIDFSQKIFHQADSTESTIVVRGIARDETNTIYRAETNLPHGLKNLSGHEDVKFISISPKAIISTIPTLDVGTPHVSCSHALSISNFSPEEIFYAKVRGLSEENAKNLITEGFLKV